MCNAKSLITSICFIICISFISSFVYAGENITTKSGLISNISQDNVSSSSVDIDIYPPEMGEKYVVKVNFLKVETSAEALDAYCDSANKREEKDGSFIADTMRELAKEAESQANLSVYDSSGSQVAHVSNLGSLTFGKKVKFVAKDSRYRAKIKCQKGAGLYHFVFEYK
ncbi:exported hypothetical protein [Candidatus Magnetomoraceae bacterium gMMP-1]